MRFVIRRKDTDEFLQPRHYSKAAWGGLQGARIFIRKGDATTAARTSLGAYYWRGPKIEDLPPLEIVEVELSLKASQ